MLISGGKVIAIDKVKHDNTLSGDGRFNALGVDTTVLLTKQEAASAYQPKGNYVDKSALNEYYKIFDADRKFATIEGTYSKQQADAKFQPIGDYATKQEVTDLEDWVRETYITSAKVVQDFASKELLASTSAQVKNEIYNRYDPAINTFEEHIYSTAVHLTTNDRELLSNLAGIEFDKYVSITAIPPFASTATIWGIKSDGDTYTFVPFEGGGGGGGYPIDPYDGLTGHFEGDTYRICIDDYAGWTAFSASMTAASSTWDTVTGKQDALTPEQISAINSITATYTLVAGNGINIAEDTVNKQTIISNIGQPVKIVDGTPSPVEAGTIYLVCKTIQE